MNLHLSNKTIYESLERAASRGELITTRINHRVIGKSTALAEFAKDNNYTVLTGSVPAAKLYRAEHNYVKVMSASSHLLDRGEKYVIEEGVTSEQLKALQNKGFCIVTGFKMSEKFHEIPEKEKEDNTGFLIDFKIHKHFATVKSATVEIGDEDIIFKDKSGDIVASFDKSDIKSVYKKNIVEFHTMEKE